MVYYCLANNFRGDIGIGKMWLGAKYNSSQGQYTWWNGNVVDWTMSSPPAIQNDSYCVGNEEEAALAITACSSPNFVLCEKGKGKFFPTVLCNWSEIVYYFVTSYIYRRV